MIELAAQTRQTRERALNE